MTAMFFYSRKLVFAFAAVRFTAPKAGFVRASEFCYFAEMEIIDLHGWDYHFE